MFESRLFGRRCVVKERFSKAYRHPVLDEKIRRTRLQDLCRLFEGFDAERAKELALQPAPTGREETPAPHKTPATAMLPQGNPHLSAAELEQARREVAPMLVD